MSPVDAVRRAVRTRLFGMPARELLRITAAMAAAGVPVVVAGGWGVDALLGDRRRPHLDLDLLVDGDWIDAAVAVLVALGYHVRTRDAPGGWWAPVVQVLRDRRLRTVELILVDPDGWRTLTAHAQPGPPPSYTTVGTILGREVGCLAPELQLAAHSGYPPTGRDRRDIVALRRLVGA